MFRKKIKNMERTVLYNTLKKRKVVALSLKTLAFDLQTEHFLIMKAKVSSFNCILSGLKIFSAVLNKLLQEQWNLGSKDLAIFNEKYINCSEIVFSISPN